MNPKNLWWPIAIGCLFLLSCNSKNKNESSTTLQEEDSTKVKEQVAIKAENETTIVDESDEVITHKIENKEDWVLKRNLRYSFEIEVPKNWATIDSSGNGDGFRVSIPNSNATIKVYGENQTPNLLSLYLDMCDETKDFVFNNGSTGSRCIKGNENTFYLANENILLNVYISNMNLLNTKHREDFISMCKSLRTISKKELKS